MIGRTSCMSGQVKIHSTGRPMSRIYKARGSLISILIQEIPDLHRTFIRGSVSAVSKPIAAIQYY